MEGINWIRPETTDDNSDSDSSSEDWEESMDMSELNFPLSDSESDEDEIVGTHFPKLSRYLVTTY